MKQGFYILIMIVGLFAGNAASGQVDDFAWSEFSRAGNTPGGKLGGTKYTYTFQGNGHHFYNADWYPGTIATTDGEIHTGYQLRYDALHDELVAFNERVSGLFVADKYNVTWFNLKIPGFNDMEFRKLSLEGTDKKEHYYEVLHRGKVSLVSRVQIVERRTSLYKNKLGRLDNRAYTTERQFYLLMNDGASQPLHPGKKNMLALFPDRKREVRRLFRHHMLYDFSGAGMAANIALLDREGYF